MAILAFKRSTSFYEDVIASRKTHRRPDGFNTGFAPNPKHTFLYVLDMFKDTLSTEPLFGISTPPNIIQQYLTVCLRWLALYPMQETEWLDMGHWPRLRDLCHFLETRLSVTQAALAEGLGQIMLRNSPYKIPPQGWTT
ncbi:MAG: hypothetical protein P8I83_02440 [Paracoccaceae bacterium]|nr:hypothetical protein [Paracoccaceae bacterium]